MPFHSHPLALLLLQNVKREVIYFRFDIKVLCVAWEEAVDGSRCQLMSEHCVQSEFKESWTEEISIFYLISINPQSLIEIRIKKSCQFLHFHPQRRMPSWKNKKSTSPTNDSPGVKDDIVDSRLGERWKLLVFPFSRVSSVFEWYKILWQNCEDIKNLNFYFLVSLFRIINFPFFLRVCNFLDGFRSPPFNCVEELWSQWKIHDVTHQQFYSE